MTRLVVVTAGLGRPSSSRLLAEQLAGATRDSLAAAGLRASTTVVDLRDLAHDVVNHLLTGYPAPRLAQALRDVEAADALIAVTPIFAASYSGLFKSFFDVLDPTALTGKPVLVGATGGTERHSLALEHAVRPLFSYLHALVVPTAVFAASSDWGAGGTASAAALSQRIQRAGAELAELLGRTVPAPAQQNSAAGRTSELEPTQQSNAVTRRSGTEPAQASSSAGPRESGVDRRLDNGGSRQPVDPFADPTRFVDVLGSTR